VDIILKNDKKTLCCETEYKVGDKIKFFRMKSKYRAIVGHPYQGTYSCHTIKLNPLTYGLSEFKCGNQS